MGNNPNWNTNMAQNQMPGPHMYNTGGPQQMYPVNQPNSNIAPPNANYGYVPQNQGMQQYAQPQYVPMNANYGQMPQEAVNQQTQRGMKFPFQNNQQKN